MKNSIPFILTILIIILVAFFYPKSSGEYPSYFGGQAKSCTCFGIEKFFSPDGGWTKYTCYGIVYNCRTYYKKSSVKQENE